MNQPLTTEEAKAFWTGVYLQQLMDLGATGLSVRKFGDRFLASVEKWKKLIRLEYEADSVVDALSGLVDKFKGFVNGADNQ